MSDKQLSANTSLKSFLNGDGAQKKLQEVLGENAQSFATTLCQIAASNSMLAEATNSSIYGAALTAASMSLPINPNLGFAYIVPYRNNKTGTVEAQFQMGWKGYVQLALRTNKFKTINVIPVYENQLGENDLLTGEIKLNNVPAEGEVIGYLSFFALLGGFSKALFMTTDEIEKHAIEYSQSYRYDKANGRKSSKWTTDRPAMSLKTVLKLLLSKFAPLSIEMRTAIEADQSVTENGESFIYPDNENEIKELTAGEKTEKAQTKRDSVKSAQGSKTPEQLI